MDLKSRFAAAEKIRKDTQHEITEEQARKAYDEYVECQAMVDRLGLFSPNETLEDISSGDLQYLQINHHLGAISMRFSMGQDRGSQLLQARSYFNDFLKIQDDYDILSTRHFKLYRQYLSDKNNFSTISTTDFTARRAEKIANFRLGKELEQKLQALSTNPDYLEDDEVVREYQLAELEQFSHSAFQELESISKEMAMLPANRPVPEVSEADSRQTSRTTSEYSDRLDRPLAELLNNGPILNRDGRPLKPFMLLDNRQRLQNGVFRPGHNLPTMTIDEYLDEERRRGGIIEGGGEASGRPATPDEDNIEKADAETMKARDWDEYVEANLKGSGNTLNRG